MGFDGLGFYLTLLVVIGGLVRWLFAVWFDQQKKLEDIKQSHAAMAFMNLEGIVNDHKKSLFDLSARFMKLENELTHALMKLDDMKQAHREALIMLKDQHTKTDKRIEDLFSDNRRISEELILVRGKRADSK